ncbi:MAG TPA: DUF6766 family protein [Solirubrobacteraceae bacterium]|nr:DUF6766 family protein [Solirubrobacteraceae bacterium]
MKRYVRENSLSLAFLTIFLASLVGQAFVGHSDFNHDQVAHQDETMSLWRFVTSSAYWVDVMENWQSEYLQFTLFILGTVWLVQRGSPESKQLDKVGRESDEDQKLGEHTEPDSPKWAKAGGWRTAIYSNSLLLLMGALMLGTWFAQLLTGRAEYNAEQFDHHEAALSVWQYAGSSDFWNRTLQNWQSEFLAILSMAVFAIWLRQRGSPESKPVGSPHDATGVEG